MGGRWNTKTTSKMEGQIEGTESSQHMGRKRVVSSVRNASRTGDLHASEVKSGRRRREGE